MTADFLLGMSVLHALAGAVLWYFWRYPRLFLRLYRFIRRGQRDFTITRAFRHELRRSPLWRAMRRYHSRPILWMAYFCFGLAMALGLSSMILWGVTPGH